MKQASLANISYADAQGLLQLRKEAIADGRATPVSAEKLASSYVLRDLGNCLPEKRGVSQQSPIARAALLGGGLGALGGLGKSWFSDDEDEQSSWGRNMLMGGVGGAALGGGLGFLTNTKARDAAIDNINQGLPSSEPKTPEQIAAELKSKRVETFINTDGTPNPKAIANTIDQAHDRSPEVGEVAFLAGSAAALGHQGKQLLTKQQPQGWVKKRLPDILGRPKPNIPGEIINANLLSSPKGKPSAGAIQALKNALTDSTYTGFNNVGKKNLETFLQTLRTNPKERAAFSAAVNKAGLGPSVVGSAVKDKDLLGRILDPTGRKLEDLNVSPLRGASVKQPSSWVPAAKRLSKRRAGAIVGLAGFLYSIYSGAASDKFDDWRKSRAEGQSDVDWLKAEGHYPDTGNK
mgnify:CR=1 FL=1